MADKLCTKCGKEFPATPEYFRRSGLSRGHSKSGLRPECKVCSLKYYKYGKKYPGADSHPIGTFKCLYCDKEFQGRYYHNQLRKYCSKKCSGAHLTEINPHRGMIRYKISNQRRTDIETIVEKCLRSMDIRYEWEKQFGRFRVDFFLPDYNMVIECDGTYWHKDKTEHDKKRDAQLHELYGISVTRFTDTQIYTNASDLLIAALAS